jgi:hypothetical protein
VALEKRTRVEIFLPVRTDTTDYRAVTDWLSEELALARGGSTLTTPFTGLYSSSTSHTEVTRDQIQILFCDLDLDIADTIQYEKLIAYLADRRHLLMELLDEEDVWIIYHQITRIL